MVRLDVDTKLKFCCQIGCVLREGIELNKKQKTMLRIIIIIFVLVAFFLPSIKSLTYRLMYKDFIEKIDKYALTANMKIVQLQCKKRKTAVHCQYQPVPAE